MSRENVEKDKKTVNVPPVGLPSWINPPKSQPKTSWVVQPKKPSSVPHPQSSAKSEKQQSEEITAGFTWVEGKKIIDGKKYKNFLRINLASEDVAREVLSAIGMQEGQIGLEGKSLFIPMIVNASKQNPDKKICALDFPNKDILAKFKDLFGLEEVLSDKDKSNRLKCGYTENLDGRKFELKLNKEEKSLVVEMPKGEYCKTLKIEDGTFTDKNGNLKNGFKFIFEDQIQRDIFLKLWARKPDSNIDDVKLSDVEERTNIFYLEKSSLKSRDGREYAKFKPGQAVLFSNTLNESSIGGSINGKASVLHLNHSVILEPVELKTKDLAVELRKPLRESTQPRLPKTQSGFLRLVEGEKKEAAKREDIVPVLPAVSKDPSPYPANVIPKPNIGPRKDRAEDDKVSRKQNKQGTPSSVKFVRTVGVRTVGLEGVDGKKKIKEYKQKINVSISGSEGRDELEGKPANPSESESKGELESSKLASPSSSAEKLPSFPSLPPKSSTVVRSPIIKGGSLRGILKNKSQGILSQTSKKNVFVSYEAGAIRFKFESSIERDAAIEAVEQSARGFREFSTKNSTEDTICLPYSPDKPRIVLFPNEAMKQWFITEFGLEKRINDGVIDTKNKNEREISFCGGGDIETLQFSFITDKGRSVRGKSEVNDFPIPDAGKEGSVAALARLHRQKASDSTEFKAGVLSPRVSESYIEIAESYLNSVAQVFMQGRVVGLVNKSSYEIKGPIAISASGGANYGRSMHGTNDSVRGEQVISVNFQTTEDAKAFSEYLKNSGVASNTQKDDNGNPKAKDVQSSRGCHSIFLNETDFEKLSIDFAKLRRSSVFCDGKSELKFIPRDLEFGSQQHKQRQ